MVAGNGLMIAMKERKKDRKKVIQIRPYSTMGSSQQARQGRDAKTQNLVFKWYWVHTAVRPTPDVCLVDVVDPDVLDGRTPVTDFRISAPKTSTSCDSAKLAIASVPSLAISLANRPATKAMAMFSPKGRI